jgi:predicted DNA-binding ribbon-helix-helix protein
VKSPIVKHSIVSGGHKTSVSLEEIAAAREVTVSNLIASINAERQVRHLVLRPSCVCAWCVCR